jgi:hypothetical protein
MFAVPRSLPNSDPTKFTCITVRCVARPDVGTGWSARTLFGHDESAETTCEKAAPRRLEMTSNGEVHAGKLSEALPRQAKSFVGPRPVPLRRRAESDKSRPNVRV